jgi:hypothetical protein
MLEIRTNFTGLKRVESHVEQIGKAYPSAARKGLRRIVRGLHALSLAKLSGSGGAGRKAQIVGPSRGFTKKSGETVNFKPQFSGAGADPVPTRTGNLRRLLGFVEPGQTKSFRESKTGKGFSGSFHAGPMEAILYNSATYANTIHEGLGSSRKFGPRRFLVDALEKMKNGEMAAIMNDEMEKIS